MAEFEECVDRQRLTHYPADGTKSPIHRCGSEQSEYVAQDVTAAICASCPVRNLPKPKPTPMANIAASQPPIQSAEWKPCKYRKSAVIITCCENEEIVICDCRGCHYHQKEVVPSLCDACEHREP